MLAAIRFFFNSLSFIFNIDQMMLILNFDFKSPHTLENMIDLKQFDHIVIFYFWCILKN